MNPEKLNTVPSAEQVIEDRIKKWQEKLANVDKLADGLGLGIDEGIKEAVVAFHAFEINTTGSHEGKIDRHPVPYIDVESPDIEELSKKLDKLEDGGTEDEQDGIRDEIFRKNLEERKKVIPLLEEFYSERKVPYEIRLGITSMARGWSRIESQGADFQEIEKDEEIKKQRLHQLQEEMHAFAEFLKNKYLTG